MNIRNVPISDHGCQFRQRFTGAIKDIGVSHVLGRVRCPAMNGKIERFFRTLRVWLRIVLLPIATRPMQRHLNAYHQWYNQHRPSSALGGRTPNEVWNDVELPSPIPIYARDPVEVGIDIQRQRCRGDPHLPVVCVSLRLEAKQAA